MSEMTEAQQKAFMEQYGDVVEAYWKLCKLIGEDAAHKKLVAIIDKVK